MDPHTWEWEYIFAPVGLHNGSIGYPYVPTGEFMFAYCLNAISIVYGDPLSYPYGYIFPQKSLWATLTNIQFKPGYPNIRSF